VWVVYLVVLVGVSLGQRQKVMAVGQPQCFNDMCFTVVGVEEVKGFLIRDERRLMRVTIKVTNRGRSIKNEGLIRAYLMDSQGRRWEETAGVNGVGLTAKVAGEDSVLSEPVFKVAGDATGLRLILTHGWRLPRVLMMGDSDSLLHRKTVVELGR
jgi:nitrogen fixation protein